MKRSNSRRAGTLACAAALVLGLTGCGGSQQLSGTYGADLYGTSTAFTFDGDAVTAKFTVAGFVVSTLEGSYELGDGEITLTFPQAETAANAAGQDLEGTFTFEQGDGYIKIGEMQYEEQ